MATKKFDKKLYDKADPLSKGVMVAWLERNGYEFINPEETYGVDITCTIGATPAFFETEIKYSWVKEWPNEWGEVRIPYRKSKIINKWIRNGSLGMLTFAIFRGDCKQAWFIDGQVVRDSRVGSLNNKYATNEKFYHVDVNDANIVNMKDSDLKGLEKNYDKVVFVNVSYPKQEDKERSEKITDAFMNVKYPA